MNTIEGYNCRFITKIEHPYIHTFITKNNLHKNNEIIISDYNINKVSTAMKTGHFTKEKCIKCLLDEMLIIHEYNKQHDKKFRLILS